jgi:hypothetical protein
MNSDAISERARPSGGIASQAADDPAAIQTPWPKRETTFDLARLGEECAQGKTSARTSCAR